GVGEGEGAVGETERLGVGGVVDAQVSEGGDAGDGGCAQRALQRAGAGVERDGDGGGVARDVGGASCREGEGRLGGEGCVGGRGGGVRGDGKVAGGGGGDVEGGGVGEGERAVGEAEGLGVRGVVEAEVGEGGDAGDGGFAQRALQRAGARVERDGDGGGVAR